MCGLELFETEHALAARSGVRRSGAAHATKAGDDHVEVRHAGVGCHRMRMFWMLFCASGCAAIIYEMVWFYLVQLVVGASSISVAVLLCAFMGGMALGSGCCPVWFRSARIPCARSPHCKPE